MRSPLIAFSLFAAVSPTIVAAAPQSPKFNNDGFAQPRNTEVRLPQRFALPRNINDPVGSLEKTSNNPGYAVNEAGKVLQPSKQAGEILPVSNVAEGSAEPDSFATRRPVGVRPDRPSRLPYDTDGTRERMPRPPADLTMPERQISHGRQGGRHHEGSSGSTDGSTDGTTDGTTTGSDTSDTTTGAEQEAEETEETAEEMTGP